MRLAMVGAGHVGAALAVRLADAGHEVVLAQPDGGSDSVARALARSSRLRALPTDQAVKDAEVVFLATPFQANQAVLPPLKDALEGKVLVDCTNPVGPGLSHGLRSERSGSEVVQALVPGARVVKAFSVYGFENLEDNAFPHSNVRPAMFLCGNDADARRTVGTLAAQMGWEPLDVGGLPQALHLEHMTLLWVRMVRAGGQPPHLAWAALRRP